ncbi:MAG: hypothetical protein AAGE01_10315 [Pseudomonadota bacterium]
MPRVLGTDLAADYAGEAVRTRHLVRLGPLRHATGGDADGDDIVWNFNTWLKFQVTVSRITWDGPVASAFDLSYILPPNLRATFRSFGLTTTVELYETAALAPGAYATANNVKCVFKGQLNGQWRWNGPLWRVRVTRTTELFPPWHYRPADGYSEFTRPGTFLIGDRTVTIQEP